MPWLFAFLFSMTMASAAEQVSPFASMVCDSYSHYLQDDGTQRVLKWGDAPLNDFGTRQVQFKLDGVRAVRQVPPPGVHPRICFTPEDLPDLRRRLKETRCGQEAWKNILSWTECLKGRYDDAADYAKPDRFNGGFRLHGRVELFRLKVPGAATGNAFVRSAPAATLWAALVDGSATASPDFAWNVVSLEAFRCLIEQDDRGGRDCAAAAATMLRLGQQERLTERQAKQVKQPTIPLPPPDHPIGGFQLAFAYDFLFNLMTREQRAAFHDELAATTWSHDNYGTFTAAEGSRSNWATFSFWLYEVLAIEDEPGFNELKVRGIYRGWRNLLTYGWFQSGATYEGEAKNQVGMDGVILFAMRCQRYGFENLAGHPYLQAYARRFLPHSVNAMLTGFHRYDLHGGSRFAEQGAASIDAIGLKQMFPDDPAIDWYYRRSVRDDYSGVPTRPDGYVNALLFSAIYTRDYQPDNPGPKSFGLGNTFFCGERALMMTRSSWDPAATQVNLHVRQANGGHPFADRNALMIAGAGRVWSPNGDASFRTGENSVVAIDHLSQSERVPGRMVDFVDAPEATFAVGDAKYCWDWTWYGPRTVGNPGGHFTKEELRTGKVVWPASPSGEVEMHTTNDFAFLKLPFAYLDVPISELPNWIFPQGAISPVARAPLCPVLKAFRTAGLIRGRQPYAVVIDDIRKDDQPHLYEWTLALEYDIQIVRSERQADGILDLYLTGADPDQKGKIPGEPLPGRLDSAAPVPVGQPMLLVRVLSGAAPAPDGEPVISEPLAAARKGVRIRRLVLPSQTVEPGFKVLLIPHRQGDAVPRAAWDQARKEVSLTGSMTERLRFTPAPSGKTDLTIMRGAETLLSVNHPIPPLPERPGVPTGKPR